MITRIKNFMKALNEEESKVAKLINKKKESAFERFPIIFTLLGTFGLVATFYGFERLIDRIDIFSDNPFILLAVGLSTLILTGSLYDRLN